jgi:hypothetical protein
MVTAPALESDVAEVTLDPRFPRVLRYRRLDTAGELAGCPEFDPFEIELNGTRYPASAFECRLEQQSSSRATYRLNFEKLELSLEVRIELRRDVLEITLPVVQERGGFRLDTLYFPHHRLYTGIAGEGAKGDSYYLAVSAGRFNWSRQWVPGTGAGGFEDTGRIADAVPLLSPLPGRGCVFNDRICLTMDTSSHTDQQVVALEASPTSTVPGRAARCSVWAGPLHYRLQGQPAPVSPCIRVAILGDYNHDGRIDWCDAAALDGDLTPQKLNDTYPNTLLYKVMCFHFTRPEKKLPFAKVLDVIKTIHSVSEGRPQVAYLVGWQKGGHDACYPAWAPIDETLGGRDALVKLIRDAKAYNCTVSLHSNLDDAYPDNPGYRKDIIATHPDGRPIVWFPNYEVGGKDVHSINHTLAVKSGYQAERLKEMLELLPIEHSIHFDAHRDVNECWLADGSFIGRESECQLGMLPTRRLYQDHGIDITTEHASAGAKAQGCWGFHGGWGSLWGMVASHGRTAVGNRAGPEGEGLGMHRVCNENGPFTWDELAYNFYTHWMYAQILHRKKMTSYRIGTWNEGVEAHYEDDTHLRSGRNGAAPLELRTRYEGIEIARAGHRFLPWDDRTIHAYSPTAGEQTWTLPKGWVGHNVAIYERSEHGERLLEERTLARPEITLRLSARVPLKLVRK